MAVLMAAKNPAAPPPTTIKSYFIEFVFFHLQHIPSAICKQSN
jgi:hypothetical protein